MKRVICCGVLSLACVLLPAIAQAKNSVPRPFTIRAQVQFVIDLTAWTATAEGEGVATHLGKVRTGGGGSVTDPIGYGTITAANGDVLYFEWEKATNLVTITGGTGRFSSATGSFSMVVQLVGEEYDAATNTLINHYDWTGTGTLVY